MPSPGPPEAPTARVLEILKAFGDHATSFQILEPGYTYWFDDEVPAPGGVVAYVPFGGFRVAAGPPLAPPEHLGACTARFVADTLAARERALFFSVDDTFLDALRVGDGSPLEYDAVEIGEQPEWDPREYTTDGPERRALRSQVARARNKGVRVRAVAADEIANAPGPLRAEIEAVLQRWLDSRRMSVMRFLVDLQPFHLPEERRYYIAEQGDRPVGFLAAIPIYARCGWFFEDVIRVPDAPNGTVELLVDTAMRDAASAGDTYVTLGLAPLAGIPETDGPHRAMRAVLRACYQRLGPLYHFDGVRTFKARFRPGRWQRQYLVQCPPRLGVRGFHALLRAFAGGGLLAFGVDTSRRWLGRIGLGFWAAALTALAALLVPWTVLLALADGQRWFGDVSMQYGWVAFDAAMVAALARLAWLTRRGRPSARMLAIFLAGATLTDFVLTTVQAFNLHADLEGWTRAFVLAGIAGPLSATALLVALAYGAPLPRHERDSVSRTRSRP